MASKFRDHLPEDRLTEGQRDERIKTLDKFAKKLSKESKRVSVDGKAAIRLMLDYVGKRLVLLDLENRHARGLSQFDSLLARTTRPVPQSLIGVATSAVLDFGRKDRERIVRRHEAQTEPLIKEISLLAPEIDKLLDLRPSPDKENCVLRPSSCLPETGIAPPDASSHSEKTTEPPTVDTAAESLEAPSPDTGKPDRIEAAPAEIGRSEKQFKSSQRKVSKPRTEGQARVDAWIEMGIRTIKTDGKTFYRNHLADKLTTVEGFTKDQRNAAVLYYGYGTSGRDSGLSDEEHAKLVGCHRSTIYDHRMAADSKMDSDPSLKARLRSSKR